MELPAQPGEPVPDSVRAAAHAAFEARDSQAQLLEPVPRGGSQDDAVGDTRLYRGVDGEVDVQVEVQVGATGLTVTTSVPAVDVSVEAPGGPAVALDRACDGAWSLPQVPRGPVSVVVTAPLHRSRTPWAVLRA